jgi:hypothetical protein
VLQHDSFLESTNGIQVRDDELLPEKHESNDRISEYLTSKLSPRPLPIRAPRGCGSTRRPRSSGSRPTCARP